MILQTDVMPTKGWGFVVERRLDGKLIARTIIADRQMRIGCAQVRMGGIGGVETDPEHRRQGHMRIVMDRAVEFMREQGFEVSLLFGITDFYPRWGYATMMADQHLTIRTENALRAFPSQPRACPRPRSGRSAPLGSGLTAYPELKVRAYRRGEMPKLDAIYNSVNALRTCSIVRPVFAALGQARPSSPLEPPALPKDSFRMGTRFFTTVSIFVVEDERANIIGYGVYDKEHADPNTGEKTPIRDKVEVAEVGATEERAYDAILAHLARLAARRKAEQMRVFVPVDHPFALHCRSYGAEHHITTRADGAAMMRIINLERLFDKLAPELTRRIAGRGLSGKLALITDIGSVALRVSNRSARVVSSLKGADYTLRLEQWKLLQLLVGYRGLEDVMTDPREAAFAPARQASRKPRLPRRLRELAEALFPTHWPYCSHPDWF